MSCCCLVQKIVLNAHRKDRMARYAIDRSRLLRGEKKEQEKKRDAWSNEVIDKEVRIQRKKSQVVMMSTVFSISNVK